MSPDLMLFIRYQQEETRRWHEWFREHPETLDLDCDISGSGKLRVLVHHVFGVNLHFAELVTAGKTSPDEQQPFEPLDALFATGHRALEKLYHLAETLSPGEMAEHLPFDFIPERPSHSRRLYLVQTLVHDIRHWAQIATFLRQRGYKTWNHDPVMAKGLE